MHPTAKQSEGSDQNSASLKGAALRRTLRLIIELLAFLSLVVVTAFLLRPLQEELLVRMTDLRNTAISKAEKVLSRSIEYESLGPSLFGTIDLRGVRIFSDRNKPLAVIPRLRIRYSLFDIIKGEPLAALRELRIDHTNIILDENRDADILALFNRNGPSSASFPLVPDKSLRIRVRNSSFVWKGKDSDLNISGLFIEASLYKQRISMDTRSSLSFRFPQLGGNLGQTELTFHSSGDIALDLSSGKLKVQIPTIQNALGQVNSQNIQVFLQKDSLEIRKVQDRIPLDFFARLDRTSGTWNAELITEEFSPRKIVKLTGNLAPIDPWLTTSLTGTASLSYTKNGQLSYLFNISGLFASNVPLPKALFRLVGSGDSVTLVLDTASLHSSRGNLDFHGTVDYLPLKMNGDLNIAAVRLADGSDLSVSFHISSENQNLSLYADTLSLGDLELSAVDIQISPKDASYDFSISALRFSDTESYGDVRLARISSDGVFYTQNKLLQFSVSVDSLAASDLLSLISPLLIDVRSYKQSWLGDVSLTTEVFISTDFKNTSFNAPRFVVAYRGDLDAFLVASVSGTNQRVSISDGRLIWKNGSATANLNIDFSDPADIPFSTQINLNGKDYSFEGIVLDRRTLSLQGSYGINANVSFSDDGAFSGYLTSQAFPIPIGNRSFSLSLNSIFKWQSARSWNINLERFEAEDVSETNPLFISSSLKGLITESGANLSELTINEGHGLLSGTGECNWAIGFANPHVTLRISGEKNERYDLEGSFQEKLASLRLYTSHAKLRRFLLVPEDSYATGELRLSFRDTNDFEASWLLSEARTKFQSEEVLFSSSGTMDSNELYIENARLTYAGYTNDISALRIDRKAGTFSASIRSKGIAVGRDADLAARAQFTFKDFPSWLNIKSALDSFKGQIDVSTARIAALEAKESFILQIDKAGSVVSVSGGPQNALRFQSAEDGAFYASFGTPLPLRGTVTGIISKGQIDAQANNIYLDFPALWHVLPFDFMDFKGGLILASLAIKGPLGDPEITGSAQASGLIITVPDWVQEEIGPISANIVFGGNDFTLGPVPVISGKGAGTVSARFVLDRWIPNTFVIDITIPRSSPIKAKADIAGVVVRGAANGILKLTLTDSDFIVSGKLEAESTLISLDAKAMEAAKNNPPIPEPVKVDLAITTGRKVEFVWPTQDLPVLRGYAVVGDTLKIEADGMSGRFSLKGDVSLRGGEVFYFQRSFYIRSGIIKFQENELQFDPKLALRAEIRDRNDAGPVLVAFVVDEAPLSSFTPRLESDPPLSQLEIFSLLGQNLVGYKSEEGTVNMQDAFISASSDVLAQFNVIRVFEQNVRDLLNLDMFSVRTQILQNAVLDATGLRSQAVDSIGGLGNYFDNTTVYLGKYISPDFFAQTMFSLRFDENSIDNFLGGIKLEPDLGIELKTPFFLIKWSFVPQHPEHLFIDDNSLTLTWKRSF